MGRETAKLLNVKVSQYFLGYPLRQGARSLRPMRGVSGILCDSGRMIIYTSRTDNRTVIRTARVRRDP